MGNNISKLKTFHLFAGAGGGILADLLLGHVPIGACETEEYPREVLLQRQRDGILPEFPIWDDVCTLDGAPWRGSVDVLCGGFPCQDISSAGKGAGIEGERSGLWKEYKRLISEIKPNFVFAENSPNLRTRGLVTILKDLNELGYDARWCVLGAGDIKAPHQRKRMWIMATNTISVRQQEQGESIKPIHQEKIINRETGLPFNDCAWGLEPCMGRVANGVPFSVDRLKSIGNGQVPGVAAAAWEILTK